MFIPIGVMLNKNALSVILIIISSCAIAQTKNIYYDNLIWTQYLLKAQLSDKWSVTADLGYRTHEYADKESQYYLRPSLTYQISPKVNFQVGYAYFVTNQFLSGYPESMRPEHRLYQRLTVTQNAGRFEIRHRYRLEERFNHNIKKGVLLDGYTQSYRLSYNIYVALPINNDKIKEKTFYIFAFDELFVSFGKSIFNNFDQNRIAAGLGYQLTKGLSASAYYQYIYGEVPTASQLYSYNAFCLSINQTIDLRKHEKI